MSLRTATSPAPTAPADGAAARRWAASSKGYRARRDRRREIAWLLVRLHLLHPTDVRNTTAIKLAIEALLDRILIRAKIGGSPSTTLIDLIGNDHSVCPRSGEI
jgi:hypothetical protein